MTEIFVPAPRIHPPSAAKFLWLNQNMRPHWTAKAKVTKAWRKAALDAVTAAQSDSFGLTRVHVTATFHKPRGGRYDAANLYPVSKACLDGIVDSGLLIDDSNDHVVGPDPRAGTPSKDRPGVTLTIEVEP